MIHEVATRMEADRPFRRLGEAAEVMTVGGSSGDPMRLLMAGDSEPAPTTAFKVYLVRAHPYRSAADALTCSWKPVSTLRKWPSGHRRSEVTGACASIYAIAISLPERISKPQTSMLPNCSPPNNDTPKPRDCRACV